MNKNIVNILIFLFFLQYISYDQPIMIKLINTIINVK